jgi:preprotein translocase subunit SecG
MTARGAGNLLTRTTAILGGVFFLLSLTLTLLAGGRTSSSVTDRLDIQGLDPNRLGAPTAPAPGSTAPATTGLPAGPLPGTTSAPAPATIQAPLPTLGQPAAPAATAPAAPAPGAPTPPAQ